MQDPLSVSSMLGVSTAYFPGSQTNAILLQHETSTSMRLVVFGLFTLFIFFFRPDAGKAVDTSGPKTDEVVTH